MAGEITYKLLNIVILVDGLEMTNISASILIMAL